MIDDEEQTDTKTNTHPCLHRHTAGPRRPRRCGQGRRQLCQLRRGAGDTVATALVRTGRISQSNYCP